MFWLFVFLIIFFLAYQCDEARHCPRNTRAFCRVSLIFLLAFISAIGSPTGQDHQWYAEVYNSINIQHLLDFTSFEHYEPGYILFNGICRLLGIPEATFFFIIGLFINGVFVNFIFKYKYPVINVFLFIIGGALIQQGNIVRQEIAAAFFVYSIRYLLVGNAKKNVITLAVASSFHLTSLFFLLLTPLCLINTEKRGKLIKYIMIGLVSGSILMALGYISLPVLDSLSVAANYEAYMTTDENIGMKFSIYRIIFFNAMALFMVFFSLKKYYKLVFILVLYAVIINISVPFPNVARMFPFFDLVSITLLLHSLGGGVLKINISKFTPLIRLAVTILIFYVVLTQYVFADEVLLCSKTYSLVDFI